MGPFDFITGLYGRVRAAPVEPTQDFHMTEGSSATPAINFSLQALLLLNEKPNDVTVTHWSQSIKTQLDKIESYVNTSKAEEAFIRPPYTCKKGGYVLVALTAMGILGLSSAELYSYAIKDEVYKARINQAKIDYRDIRDGNESSSIFSVTNQSCLIMPYESLCTPLPCSVYDDFFESCKRQLFYSGNNCTRSIDARMKIYSPLKYSQYEDDCAVWRTYISVMMQFLGALSGLGALAMPVIVLKCYNKLLIAKIMGRPVDLLDGEMQSSLLTERISDKKDEDTQVFTIGYAKNTLKLMFSKSKEQLENSLPVSQTHQLGGVGELKSPLLV